MAEQVSEIMRGLLKEAARLLTGAERRAFLAKTTLELFDGSARKAQRRMGWNRDTVQLGLHELRTGIRCVDNFSARGRKKTEALLDGLDDDLRSLVDAHAQADPQMRTTLAYTRMTASRVRQALIDEKGYSDEQLPSLRTISEVLNRLGYRLRRVQKTRPKKKVPETDAIFDNVARRNRDADADPQVVRISIDAKANVEVGEFSRDGRGRGAQAVTALDHEMAAKTRVVPFGILEVETGKLDVTMGTSAKTSDFVVDCLEAWWAQAKQVNTQITELVINTDGGPETNGRRTRFLERMVGFACQTGLRIRLVYYPPYHSKYNPIERCWAALEKHWNATLLCDIDTVVEWAGTMTWKGVHPAVALSTTLYAKGVRVTKAAMRTVERFITRHPLLPNWDLLIDPHLRS